MYNITTNLILPILPPKKTSKGDVIMKANHSVLKKMLSLAIGATLIGGLAGCVVTPDYDYGDRPIYKDDRHQTNKHHDREHKNDYKKKYKADDVEDRIKREARYPAIKRQAVRKIQSMGYRVDEIELDEKNGRGIFEIEAKRGGQEYEIELGYPNLNVIKIEKD